MQVAGARFRRLAQPPARRVRAATVFAPSSGYAGLAATREIAMAIPRHFRAIAIGMHCSPGRSRWRLALLVALSLLCLPAAAQTLRVMTFNVRLPVASDGDNRWENRRELMARVIERQQPDVFGTQELFKSQGDFLVERLPRYAWFGEGRRGGDGDEHMGVFYRTDRLRVVESGNFWLSDTPQVPGSISWGHPYPRMTTWALFERIADGRRFYLFDTHLPYREEDEDARVRGAQLIVQHLQALPASVPVVLVGDFNTAPDTRTHSLLASSLHDAWIESPRRDGPEATFHDFTGTPDRRIDWILQRGFEVERVRTVTTHAHGRYPSDHFPVLATLRWQD
jgi:endonuclease/exonuclease/phosphatase family metal-dependent hydrolase